MRRRGQLRLYLGAAPGVGKTYAMLGEGHRRQERGTDVVVGYVETHGRAKTGALLDGLEIIRRKAIEYRGSTFTEMDVDAVLARHPAVALVDELAHTNVPGSRNPKRWQDVEELLDAGIDVLSTVNVQHLESLNDVVQKITGIEQQETVPDAVARAANQVELIDMTPEALRRRMAHGNVYAAERIDAALSNYFRVGNLTALRELALLWLADKVDEGLQQYRDEHHIKATWEARERVVVGLTGGPEGDTLVRRAARIAARGGSELLAVYVARADGLTGGNPKLLAEQRALVETLGGSFHQVVGDDVARALLAFARAENATQLVLGASRRSRLRRILGGAGVGRGIIRNAGDIDVHIVTHEHVGSERSLPRLEGGLTVQRRLAGALLAIVLMPLLTLALAGMRGSLNVSTDLLVFLVGVVVVALVGGMYPALLAAVGGSVLLNYYFIPPLYQFTIAERNNVVALVVFVLVAVLVSLLVELAARRTREAQRRSAEARTLSELTSGVLRGDSVQSLLEQVRETFGQQTVTLLERPEQHLGSIDARAWDVLACAGDPPCTRPEEGDAEVPIGDRLALVLRGRPLAAEDRRILAAFAAQAAAGLERRRLEAAAAAAKPMVEADRLRTALLNAVSHDLRTPLASAKAAVSSLRSHEVDWPEDDRDELLATADESLDRLIALVENLLDMSRLQAGALRILPQRVGVGEIVASALDDLGPQAPPVGVTVPADLPDVIADSALLTRIVVNLIANAVRFSPPDDPPLVTASALGDLVEVRVIDHGPGIPPNRLEEVFTPFQRMGDTDNSTGVGLGLALSRGLAEAMDATIAPEETPGGGLTMVLSLRAAPVGGGDVAAAGRVRPASRVG